MAVIDNFEVAIVVDGKDLAEYNEHPMLPSTHPDYEEPARDEETKVRKFVEVAPGTRFEIKYRLLPGYRFGQANFLSYDTCIDGQLKDRPTITRERYEFSIGFSTVRHGSLAGGPEGWTEQGYQFASLEIDPEASKSPPEHTTPVIGFTKVKIWPKKGKIDNSTTLHSGQGIEGTVSEKLIKGKAIDQFTTLGAARKTKPSNIWTGKKIGSEPLATITFLYRSRQALIELGIVERPRSPTPLRNRDRNTLNTDEMRQLLKEIERECEAEKAKIKKEKTEQNLLQLQSLKRSRSAADNEDDSDIEETPRPKQFKVRETSIHEEIL